MRVNIALISQRFINSPFFSYPIEWTTKCWRTCATHYGCEPN